MNYKKILLVSISLLLLVTIVGAIAPVNAALNPHDLWTDSNKQINGKTNLNVAITSDIGIKTKNPNSANYISKRKTELNKVNKVVVTIKGYKPITFKKPAKGWDSKKYHSQYFMKTFTVKGNPNGKDYTIGIYDKKDKLIKNKKGHVHSH